MFGLVLLAVGWFLSSTSSRPRASAPQSPAPPAPPSHAHNDAPQSAPEARTASVPLNSGGDARGAAARGLLAYYNGGGRDKATIKRYQRTLGVRADGIVGPETQAAVQRYLPAQTA